MPDSRIDDLLAIADRISRGEIPEYQHNECYTSGAFDLLLIHAHDAEAFALLREACNRYRNVQAASSNLKGYFVLLSCLAANSRTTEVPGGMIEIRAEKPMLSRAL